MSNTKPSRLTRAKNPMQAFVRNALNEGTRPHASI